MVPIETFTSMLLDPSRGSAKTIKLLSFLKSIYPFCSSEAYPAAGDNFKRQNSYYSGNEQYWSSDHTLLDTAYVVVKFQIDADSTTVPEMEYVVKGKALECFNYDGTFVHDPVYQASTNAAYGGEADSHTNFKEGDIVSVETSFDGNTWQSETGFRILHIRRWRQWSNCKRSQ